MGIGIDPKIDYAFKRLFGVEKNSGLLIALLNAVLGLVGDRRIVIVELLNPFNEKETSDDKLSIVDIKARDQSGRWFHIEMQMTADKYLAGRLVYYWARLFSQQINEGDEYAKLQPTISICFLNDRMFRDAANWRLRFELWDKDHQVRLTDLMAIHLFELPNFERSDEQLQDDLDRWLYFLIHGAELDPMKLPAKLQVPHITQALKELSMLQFDASYEARLKNSLDENSRRRFYETGLAEALEQGREQERVKGLAALIQFTQRLLNLPLTPIEQLQAQSVGELQQMAESLEEQALRRYGTSRA